MVKMSSKGQIVIPHGIRVEMNAVEGTLFAVVNNKEGIILKKVATPSKKDLIDELQKIAREGKKRLEARNIKEEDIPYIVEKTRKK